MIRVYLDTDTALDMTPAQAGALLGLIRDASRLFAFRDYLAETCAAAAQAECTPKAETTPIEPIEPTVSPGSTPANTEVATVRESRERSRQTGGKSSASRSRKRQATVAEVSLMLGEKPADPAPQTTIVPSPEPGKKPLPTPPPSPIDAPKSARKPREAADRPSAPKSPPVPTLVNHFVVPLPDGRETYVAVYSDGSVHHETTGQARAA